MEILQVPKSNIAFRITGPVKMDTQFVFNINIYQKWSNITHSCIYSAYVFFPINMNKANR